MSEHDGRFTHPLGGYLKQQNILKILYGILAAAWGVLLGGSAMAGEDPLILGIFPRFGAALVQDTYAPLAQYLSSELGREIRLETAPDQNEFWKVVSSRRYDIVHFNQWNYIESHQKFGYDVVAMNEEFGKSTVAGAIVVRKDSGFHGLEDLRGKTIVFGGGPKAMVAYIANVALLQHAGLKRGAYQEEFAKNSLDPIMTVFNKQAAAGGIGDVVLKAQALGKKIDTDELKVLAVGEPLAHLPWAVKTGHGPALARKIQNALIRLNTPGGEEVLKQAQLTGFVAATDSDYNACRKIIKEVLGNDAVK